MVSPPAKHSSRPRHTELSPLITAHKHPDRRMFVSPVYRSPPSASSTPDSAISLASPTLATIRQYYRDNGMTTALQLTPIARQGSVPQHFPRRHSSISVPNQLAQRLHKVIVSSPLAATPPSPRRQRPRYQSIAEETRNQLLVGVEEDQRKQLASVVAGRRGSVQHDAIASVASKIPFGYTHKRLRHWGYAYLGNTGTADVFVRAVHLRKPDITIHKEDSPILASDVLARTSNAVEADSDPKVVDTEQRRGSLLLLAPSQFDEVVIRARVTPPSSSKDRKPFVIQRHFDVAELRASIATTRRNSSMSSLLPAETTEKSSEVFPPATELPERKEFSPLAPTQAHGRGRSLHLPRPIKELPIPERRVSIVNITSAKRRTMPIHVEYALHYLPVLAALMLSGHIRKGDTIDLPLPNPEVWAQTVAWVYTGRAEMSGAMAENILYLGGRLDI